MARSESTVRVAIPPRRAFQMWSDLERLSDFMPSVCQTKRGSDGSVTVSLCIGDHIEKTKVAFTAIEKPRRLVWRSSKGARWNGELVFRPTVDGTEIRFIIDYEPTSLRENPTVRSAVVPTWNVGGDLLAFKNYAEKARIEEREAEPVGA